MKSNQKVHRKPVCKREKAADTDLKKLLARFSRLGKESGLVLKGNHQQKKTGGDGWRDGIVFWV